MMLTPRPKLARPGRLPIMAAPDALARQYRAELRALVAKMNVLIDRELLDPLPGIAASRDRLVRTDANGGWAGRIMSAVTAIRMGLADDIRRLERRALDLGSAIADYNGIQWRRVVEAAVGVNIFKAEPWLSDQIASFAAENAQLIRSLPEDALKQIEGMAQRGVRTGQSSRQISAEIRGKFGATKARADLIARDQVSKLNGNLTEIRQRQAGITTYKWRTGRDERVRDSHEVLEGMLCRWDDPTVYSDDNGQTWKKRSSIGGYIGHPGSDYRCRCSAESDVESVLKSLGI